MNESPTPVVFCNDKASLNERYRGALMQAVINAGSPTTSLGVFETGRPALWNWARIAFGRSAIISSNLRCNLVVMLFARRRGLVIVNGLGRHRTKPLLRKVLHRLINRNSRKAVAFQNYADFRWARRFTRHTDLHWVPGSGGRAKEVGTSDMFVLVTRDDKIDLVAPSLRRLYAADNNLPPLCIVGCRDAKAGGDTLHGVDHTSVGFVAADAILSFGHTFVQPGGYGEGLPHSMADAIVSGMPIIIQKREIQRYGLSRLGATATDIGNGWQTIVPQSDLRAALSEPVVTNRYLDLFINARD